MNKDQMKKDGEISADELEQVSGGMTPADINAGKFYKEYKYYKEISPLSIDILQNVKNIADQK